MYKDFYSAIATSSFLTPFIHVGKGVLQGDCFSPLAFNMVINTFIQHIKSEQYAQLGYSFVEGFSPRHWYQFADDAAAVTSLESENQILLNAFTRWCTWSDMTVRVDKCQSFGITKIGTQSKQVKPKLTIANRLIPAVEIGKSFKYLGKYFDYEMSDKDHKEELLSKVKEMLEIIDSLPLHPKNKLLIYSRFLLSQISWHLTVSQISQTWIKQNLDNVVASYVRKWLEIPISGTLDIVALGRAKFGLNFTSVSARFAQCQVTNRKCLSESRNKDIRTIHNKTSSHTNIQYDQHQSTRDALKAIRDGTEERIVKSLTTQKLVITAIWNSILPRTRSCWFKVLEKLPKNIYNFCIRYLNNSLPNASNTERWKTTESASCKACGMQQTLGHVVAGCPVHLDERRYNWRHDSVLLNIMKLIPKSVSLKEYADIEDKNFRFSSPSVITGDTYTPDIVLVKDELLVIVELTVGFETNIEKNGQRKREKYKDLMDTMKQEYEEVIFVNLTMGALGIIGRDSSNLYLALSKLSLDAKSIDFLVKRIINVCIRSTYYIFCIRDKEWTDPELMSW